MAALAEDLAGLDEDQWRHATLCGDWDVEQVVAHLTAAASLNQVQWLRSMLGARFRPNLVQLIIGVLFVSISATVTPASLHHILLPTLALVAVLVVVTRPLVAFVATNVSSGSCRGRAR